MHVGIITVFTQPGLQQDFSPFTYFRFSMCIEILPKKVEGGTATSKAQLVVEALGLASTSSKFISVHFNFFYCASKRTTSNVPYASLGPTIYWLHMTVRASHTVPQAAHTRLFCHSLHLPVFQQCP